MARHVGALVGPERCRRCGACISVCPAGAVELKGYRPVVDGCTGCPEFDEGLCAAACPALGVDYDRLEERLFGRSRRPDEPLGVFRQALRAISLHPKIRSKGYGGGTATALIYAALASGFADAAVICTWDDGHPWRPGPRLVTRPGEALLGAGSKYFPSPNLRALRELEGARRVLLVGLPCHIAALRKMEYGRNPVLRQLAGRVRLALGTFCGIPSMLTAEGFASLIAEKTPLDMVARVSSEAIPLLKGARSYRVHTRDGRVLEFPVLQLLRKLGRSGGRLPCPMDCFDYSAELADLSVGGTLPPELPTRYLSNVLLVRTRMGEQLVQTARRMGLLHASPLGRLRMWALRLFPPFRRKRSRYLYLRSRPQPLRPEGTSGRQGSMQPSPLEP